MSFDFLEIFGSHYGIPFWLSQISLLAKISVLKHCFCFVFSVFLLCVFADILLFLLLLPPSPWLTLCHLRSPLLASAVMCHSCCCVCHIFTACAVVPGVCCASSCFFEVVLLIFLCFSLLLPLWCRVFPVLVVCVWCFLVSLCGGCWCVSRVWCCVLCVYCFCCVFVLVGCLVVWLCPRFCGVVASCVSRVAGVCLLLCLCSSGCSVLFWVVRCFVVLLVLVWLRWCCSWCVSCVVALLVGCGGCVALSAFFAPGCSWLVHASGCCSFWW